MTRSAPAGSPECGERCRHFSVQGRRGSCPDSQDIFRIASFLSVYPTLPRSLVDRTTNSENRPKSKSKGRFIRIAHTDGMQKSKIGSFHSVTFVTSGSQLLLTYVFCMYSPYRMISKRSTLFTTYPAYCPRISGRSRYSAAARVPPV